MDQLVLEGVDLAGVVARTSVVVDRCRGREQQLRRGVGHG
jgi:hypothetical protein